MTTIAWDGRSLAGDTQSSVCGNRVKAQKIWRLNDDLLFGGSGEFQIVLAVKDWLNGGAEKPKLPSDAEFSGLLIRRGRAFRLWSYLVEVEILEPYAACGTGQDFALAAMFLGKSAEEAVWVACQFDVNTGGDVEVLDYEVMEGLKSRAG